MAWLAHRPTGKPAHAHLPTCVMGWFPTKTSHLLAHPVRVGARQHSRSPRRWAFVAVLFFSEATSVGIVSATGRLSSGRHTIWFPTRCGRRR